MKVHFLRTQTHARELHSIPIRSTQRQQGTTWCKGQKSQHLHGKVKAELEITLPFQGISATAIITFSCFSCFIPCNVLSSSLVSYDFKPPFLALIAIIMCNQTAKKRYFNMRETSKLNQTCEAAQITTSLSEMLRNASEEETSETRCLLTVLKHVNMTRGSDAHGNLLWRRNRKSNFTTHTRRALSCHVGI